MKQVPVYYDKNIDKYFTIDFTKELIYDDGSSGLFMNMICNDVHCRDCLLKGSNCYETFRDNPWKVVKQFPNIKFMGMYDSLDEFKQTGGFHVEQKDTSYKDRMKVEYKELKERYNKLHNMIVKYEAGVLDFTPDCSIDILKNQKAAMGHYLYWLEVRAVIEKVEL